ncbi:Chitinase 4 [Tilletia horrida]|nr:Chitinase 4 [Tilletia horrida]
MKFGGSIRKLGLALLFATAAVLVSATPLNTDEHGLDGSLELFARAANAGKYVGSACTTSDECYSKNCVEKKKGTKTCQRQPEGGPCFKDANCASRNCGSNATCITPSKLHGECPNGDECGDPSLQCDFSNYHCRTVDGYKCKKASDCVSGSPCTDNICGKSMLGPNRACNTADQCLSGGCSLPTLCPYDDGLYTICVGLTAYTGYTAKGVCDRYPLGHSCVHPGDCLEGQCKGTCTNSTVGDPCRENYQCTNGQACSNEKCTTFADRSQYPGVDCSADIQCMSNECSQSYSQGSNGLWTHYSDSKRDGPSFNQPTCAPIANGQGMCRNYADCSTGICSNGICKEGKAGDRCIANAQCEDDLVCSLDGVCTDPTKKLGKFEPCKNGSQCLSTVCSDRAQRETSRPSLEGIGGGSTVTVEFESVCAPSSFNKGCDKQSDCGQGTCTNGTCVGKARGDSCTDPSQCTSLSCTIPDGKTTGTCTLGAAYSACDTNADCYSNNCGTGDCFFSDPLICPPRNCQIVDQGDQCRTSADCVPFGGCYQSVCYGFGG